MLDVSSEIFLANVNIVLTLFIDEQSDKYQYMIKIMIMIQINRGI